MQKANINKRNRKNKLNIFGFTVIKQITILELDSCFQFKENQKNT